MTSAVLRVAYHVDHSPQFTSLLQIDCINATASFHCIVLVMPSGKTASFVVSSSQSAIL